MATISGLNNNDKTSLLENRAKTSAFRCDFCDITLKSDLDVSKHLVTQRHLAKRDEFLCLQNPHDRIVQKELPRNLPQVYTTLKVRSVRDLKDLADKNYFKIPPNDVNLCGVAKELSKVLLKRMAMYELQSCRHYPQEVIDQILEILLKPRERGPLYRTPQAEGQSKEIDQRERNNKEIPNESSNSYSQKVNARVNANDQPSTSSRSPDMSRVEHTTHRSQQSKPSKVQNNNHTGKSPSVTRPCTSVSSDRSANQPPTQVDRREHKNQGQKPPKKTKTPDKPENKESDTPQPRLDSTYKPQLAKIKVEPKD